MLATACGFESRPGYIFLMRHLRSLLRIALIIPVTFFFYALYRAGSLPLRAAGREPHPWMNRCTRAWAAITAALLGLKIRVIGSGCPPELPFILVSNHLSYLDVLLFFRTTGGVFVTRHDVAEWPVLGTMMRSMGMIFVDRDKPGDLLRVNREIGSALDAGRGVIIFPEGTTSRGEDVLPFNSPLMSLPARKKIPVHYASIRYKTDRPDRPVSEWICWWDDTPFVRHVWRLAGLGKIVAEVRFGSSPMHLKDRKELARRLHEKVSEGYRLAEKVSV